MYNLCISNTRQTILPQLLVLLFYLGTPCVNIIYAIIIMVWENIYLWNKHIIFPIVCFLLVLWGICVLMCFCEESVYWCVSVRNLCIDVFLWGICVLMCFCEESVYWCVSVRNLCIDVFLWGIFSPPKGAKLYPASRRRSSKRVGLKGQLAPHHVPWLKNYIMAYKRLSTSLGSKTLNTSLGLGGTTIKTRL